MISDLYIRCQRCNALNKKERSICWDCRALLEDPTLTNEEPRPQRTSDTY